MQGGPHTGKHDWGQQVPVTQVQHDSDVVTEHDNATLVLDGFAARLG